MIQDSWRREKRVYFFEKTDIIFKSVVAMGSCRPAGDTYLESEIGQIAGRIKIRVQTTKSG